MSELVQEVSSDIKDRFDSGTESINGWFKDMDPQLKGQLLTALLGAGGGGILGGLLTGSHTGESSSDRRMRLVKNALLGALLGGVGGFGLHRGGEELQEAFTPTKEDLAADADQAQTNQTVGAVGGGAVGGLASIPAAKALHAGLGSFGPKADQVTEAKRNFGNPLKRTGERGGFLDEVAGWAGDKKPMGAASMTPSQKQQLFDHLINTGKSPTEARDILYNLKGKVGWGESAPRRKTGERPQWLERIREARGARTAARTGGKGQLASILPFLDELFDTTGTSGAGQKALQGSKNVLSGINNRLVPSRGAMGRTMSRGRWPAALAAVAALGYGGKRLGEGISDVSFDDQEAIDAHEEAE